MYTVFVAGGIGSGKSTVARELERRGAVRIDLDELSRAVLAPGSETCRQVAEAFGMDLLDSQTGELDRAALASRAFASDQDTRRLEDIELPAIREALQAELARLARQGFVGPCVVEVPLLDRMQEGASLANEVLVVSCPAPLRRARAVARGMRPQDVDARMSKQPSDAWLAAHATSTIDNAAGEEQLAAAIDAWWQDHRGAWEGAGAHV